MNFFHGWLESTLLKNPKHNIYGLFQPGTQQHSCGLAISKNQGISYGILMDFNVFFKWINGFFLWILMDFTVFSNELMVFYGF